MLSALRLGACMGDSVRDRTRPVLSMRRAVTRYPVTAELVQRVHRAVAVTLPPAAPGWASPILTFPGRTSGEPRG
jgi:hypothetical protein